MTRNVFNANGTAKADLFKVALSTLTDDHVFQLTDVRVNHLTDENGKATESVKGVTYTIFVPAFMCQLNVKVDATIPVISSEKLAAEMETGNEIFVELPTTETFIKPYAISYGAFSVTIHAPFIKLA